MANNHNERVNASVGGKRIAERRGVVGCEYCGWTPHVSFSRNRRPGRKLCLVILHHIVPAKYADTYPGDIHAPANTIVLCPNHAAIADAISGTHDNRTLASFNDYRGPKTREELLENLRLVETAPDDWATAYWPKFCKQKWLEEMLVNVDQGNGEGTFQI